jgi:hypothetical protein
MGRAVFALVISAGDAAFPFRTDFLDVSDAFVDFVVEAVSTV